MIAPKTGYTSMSGILSWDRSNRLANQSDWFQAIFTGGDNTGVRKKLICIGLLPAGVGLGYLFYISLVIGLVVSRYFSGEKDGIQGRVRSVIISWRRYELHLHHWFLSSLAGAIFALQGSSLLIPELLYGFIGGLVFQGIYFYSDWYRIVKRKIS